MNVAYAVSVQGPGFKGRKFVRGTPAIGTYPEEEQETLVESSYTFGELDRMVIVIMGFSYLT
eukprot:CAMPEP_0185786376 /NCGR_PEP_ID=MMETSP1174-20130828/135025_1 /TAXON_ID=35687 /ORGANISM="Dictyocha speculum, Strain CCMP1381" /LENGTH=61 /DNA_ID=CAMNT_0028478973 /DNA_START=34 /DNA_END=215 /DNA_ORIENTATION=+